MKNLLALLSLFIAFVSNAQTVSISSSATGAICAGTNVTFTASLTGYTTPSYQWYKNNVAIAGATNAVYSSSSLSNSDVINVAVFEGGATVSTSGLVLNLDAGNSSSYSSGATTWTDLSGRGNNGTLSSVAYSSSNQGYLTFNGTSSYVSLPNSTDFNFGTGDFTVEFWTKHTGDNTKTPNFVAINSNNSFYSAVRIGWFMNSGNPTVAFSHSTNGTSWAVQWGFTGFDLSTWSQIVLSRTAGVVTMYANGVNKGTYNLSGSLMTTTTSNPINNQLGTLPNYQSLYTLLGNMSIVRYYKAAGLTSSQVISNYNAICSRYGLNPIGTTSNSITTTVNASPSIPAVTVTGDACINKTTLNTPSGLSSYTWYKDNLAISGATTNTFTPTAAGDYKVAVSNGTCSTISTTTPIYTCGVTADGKMVSITTPGSLLSLEGGANFGTGLDYVGKIINTTGLTTTTGTIGATTAVLGGVISATNAVTSSIGVIYSTDPNFSTSSNATIQSNVIAGTYTSSITGLSSTTTYYAKSYLVNKAGTTYGPVVSFTTTTPPITLGSLYGGGFVFYIFQSTDAGYVSGETHGLIAETRDQTTNSPTNPNFDNTNWCTWNNALSLIADPNNHSTAGKLYTDWRFPTKEELLILYTRVFGYDYPAISTYKSTFNSNFYWSSTSNPNNSSQAWVVGSGTSYPDGDKATAKLPIRSIRSF